jgi:hypothetical protein
LNTELKKAQEEVKEANAKAFAVQKQLDDAKQEVNHAKFGMTKMEKLMPAVYAEMDSLRSQLNESRQDEEKTRTDISSLERELHTARLEHSKRIASFEEQLRNSRQEVGEKDPLIAQEGEVNDNLQATATTPATASTPEPDYTPERAALTKSWNAREMELPVYLEGMLALTTSTRPLKRRPSQFEATPRRIKKLRPSEESADCSIANVLTPGGWPAFELPKQGLVGRVDDGIALDGSEGPRLFNAENFNASTADHNDANQSVLPEQDAAKAGIDPLGAAFP